MFKSIHNKIWAFDCEWIPDPVSGKAVYNLPDDLTDSEAIQAMWEEGGATDENPMPYLKTAVCRIVSIAAVTRTLVNGVPSLRLLSLPRDTTDSTQTNEKAILEVFLNAIGQHKPQLVGYNSISSDLKIMIQRGIVNGVQAEGFCRRPEKPWEGVDYFARGSDHNIDLMDIVGGWGKSSPSLHEIATASGIPGKMAVDGNQVAELWLEGRLPDIVAYNEYDAITTYLLWLQTALFAGFVNRQQYEEEQGMLKELLTTEAETGGKSYLTQYLDEWLRLEKLVRPLENN